MSRIERLLDLATRVLEAAIAACLLVMVVLVFGNVVLRYGFDSGITVAEELSRWFFLWLTFLGALIGMREHAHLGTDVLVGRLGPRGRKACLFACHVLMLLVCWMFFRGSLEQTKINWDSSAPSSGASMAWVYGVGLVFSVGAALIVLVDLWKLLSGRTGEADLIQVRDDEAAA